MNRAGAIALKYLPLLLVLLAAAAPALADVPVNQAPQNSGSQRFMSLLSMFIMLYFVLWFLLLRPQQKKALEQQKLATSLKKGDLIVTSGGVFGKVAAVEPDHVALEIAPNVKVRVEPGHIARRQETPGASKPEKTAA